MIADVIILAGGFGTRLKPVVNDLPKPMADINGKPFLEYLLNYLNKQGIENIFLSVGYKYEYIENYFGLKYNNLNIFYSIEEEPLGTGGAVRFALNNFDFCTNSKPLLIINGDTFFNIDLSSFYDFHLSNNSQVSIALKSMSNFDRYGTVLLDENSKVRSFNEKKMTEHGLINAGIYIIDSTVLNHKVFQKKFSLERDFFEQYLNDINIYGKIFDEYFIDIGIPADYRLAKKELVQKILNRKL